MSEAIILYRGRGGGVSEEDKRPKVYTNNGVFKAPFTGNYLVSCVGGGGGGGGGCRNIWNSSQVYYGAGGSRGGYSSGNVWLNQGDEVTMTMGPGGSAGTNNTTVVSYNSRGTSGSAGSTTTFGSYKSAAGGAAGSYSWMWRTTYNTIDRWDNKTTTTKTNVYAKWDSTTWIVGNQRYLQNGIYINDAWKEWGLCNKCWTYSTIYNAPYPATRGKIVIVNYVENSFNWGGGIVPNDWKKLNLDRTYTDDEIKTITGNNNTCSLISFRVNVRAKCETCGTESWYWMGASWGDINNEPVNNIMNRQKSEMLRVINTNIGKQLYVIFWGGSGSGIMNSLTRIYTGEKTTVTNTQVPVWNNGYTNQTTRCYTSIQQGTWWYLNNNTVSTAGTRAYSGDGGQSGGAGNSGFILIYPQWSE